MVIPSFSSRYHAYCASSPFWEALLPQGPYVKGPNALHQAERDGGSLGWDCCVQQTWASSETYKKWCSNHKLGQLVLRAHEVL